MVFAKRRGVGLKRGITAASIYEPSRTLGLFCGLHRRCACKRRALHQEKIAGARETDAASQRPNGEVGEDAASCDS